MESPQALVCQWRTGVNRKVRNTRYLCAWWWWCLESVIVAVNLKAITWQHPSPEKRETGRCGALLGLVMDDQIDKDSPIQRRTSS